MRLFRKAPLPEITNEGYARWLRAQCPPMQWFLGLSDLEQEQLALLGDEHSQDQAIAVAYALRDPDAASAGMAAAGGDMRGEETLVRKAATELAERIIARRSKPNGQPATTTMAGMGSLEAREEPVPERTTDAKIFGRAPDGGSG